MTRHTLEVIRGALLAERSKWLGTTFSGEARKYENALREVEIELELFHREKKGETNE